MVRFWQLYAGTHYSCNPIFLSFLKLIVENCHLWSNIFFYNFLPKFFYLFTYIYLLSRFRLSYCFWSRIDVPLMWKIVLLWQPWSNFDIVGPNDPNQLFLKIDFLFRLIEIKRLKTFFNCSISIVTGISILVVTNLSICQFIWIIDR